MNKIRIVLMLCFWGGIFLASGDWANSEGTHQCTPPETPKDRPVRTDIPDRRPSDSSQPVDSGLSDGIPNEKSKPASSDIEKLEKQYLKQGDKKKDTKKDVPKGISNEKSKPASSDLPKTPSENTSIEKPEKQSLTQVDKKKDTEEDVPKQSTTQKAPWYSVLCSRVVEVYDRAVVSYKNTSIANKKARLEQVNADVIEWDRDIAKRNVDRFMDDAAMNQGRDFTKKFTLNPLVERKAQSRQMDDSDGNIAAAMKERDKAKAKQLQLKKEIAGLEAQVAKIQSKSKSVTPVSSKPSAGIRVNPSEGGKSEREPATSGYAPRPRAK